MDIQYNRNEEFKTNKTSNLTETSPLDNEDRPNVTFNDDSDVDTTVIFLPNVWSLTPNSLEYQKIVEAYKNLIDCDLTIDDTSKTSSSNLTNGHNKQDENDQGGLLKPSSSSTTDASSTTTLPSATPSKAYIIYFVLYFCYYILFDKLIFCGSINFTNYIYFKLKFKIVIDLILICINFF